MNNMNKYLLVVLYMKMIREHKKRKKKRDIDFDCVIDFFANDLVNLIAKDDFDVFFAQFHQ